MQFLQKITVKSKWFAITLFLIGFAFSIIVAQKTRESIEDKELSEYKLVCKEIEIKISARLHAHAQLLRDGASYFTVSDTVTRKDWKDFIETCQVSNNLPGIQGVGFSYIIPKNQLSKQIQRIRNEGFPEYTIRPEGERDLYTSILYLEPFSDKNLRAFGYDMYSEPIRRKAMEYARDNNVASISGKVLLVQESETDLQAGTLMYVPLYRKGWPTATIEERRAAIIGWIYSPYRMNDLMNGILGRWDSPGDKRIHLQVYDNAVVSEESLLFDSQKTDTIKHFDSRKRSIEIPIEFNGTTWNLCYTQSTDQVNALSSKVWFVLVSGIIISFLFSVLVFVLLNTKANARKMAIELTAELNESEEKYRKLVEFSPDAILMYSGGIIRFASAAAVRLFRANSAEELIGKKVTDLVHPDYLDQVIDRIKALETKGEAPLAEEKLVRLDGEVFDAEVVGIQLTIKGQKYYQTISRDISRRKKAEEGLRDANWRMASIIEATNAGTWEWNISTDEVIFNDLWAEMIGYELAEIIPATSRKWESSIHPDDLLVYKKVIDEHLSGVVPFFDFECRIKHKDGYWIWQHNRGRVITRDKDGKALMMFGSSINITERKNTEENLKILSSAVEQSPVSIVITDINGKIEYGNPNVLRLTGYEADEILGKNPRIFNSGTIPKELFQDLWNTILSGKEWRGEFHNKKKNGDFYWESATISSIKNEKGEITKFLAVKENITQKKEAEEEIKAKNEQLKLLIGEKDKFFSIISHDLRSPFNSFIGLTQLIADDLPTLKPEQVQEYANSMRNSAINLYRLLMNLLEWSKLNQGLIVFNPEYIPLRNEVFDVIELVLQEAEKKQITISVDISEQLTVYVDRNLLHTLIRNLVSNAVKFTKRGGTINISDQLDQNNFVKISVQDSGIGMSREMLGNLFRIDVKTNRNGTEGELSTGLGLLLCKDLIERIGGQLSVESNVGQGSLFQFTIPNNPV